MSILLIFYGSRLLVGIRETTIAPVLECPDPAADRTLGWMEELA